MNAKLASEGLIIDVPEQLGRARRATEAGVAALAAVLWLLAVRPMLLLGIWYLGGQVVYTHMVKLEGWNNSSYFRMLGSLASGLAGLLFAWSRVNAFRFRRRERRRLETGAAGATLPAHFGLCPEHLVEIRAARRVRIERLGRTQVIAACAGGGRFVAEHEPLGLPSGTPRRTSAEPRWARAARGKPAAATSPSVS